VTPECLPAILAMTIEREDGLPCGCCGGRHVETMQEWRTCEHPCLCRCCDSLFGEWFESEFPDLVTIRGRVHVITEVACAQAISRLEAEPTSLEEDAA
jgi:hypothetical protein